MGYAIVLIFAGMFWLAKLTYMLMAAIAKLIGKILYWIVLHIGRLVVRIKHKIAPNSVKKKKDKPMKLTEADKKALEPLMAALKKDAEARAN